MIFADIQTTFGVMLWLFCLGSWLVAVVVFRVLRATGRTMHESYQKGGGNRQLAKNVVTKGAGHILKRLFIKLILKR